MSERDDPIARDKELNVEPPTDDEWWIVTTLLGVHATGNNLIRALKAVRVMNKLRNGKAIVQEIK